ncbi:hypothetical protein BDD43_3396 [Mucilaginibacter gracilis]|uniref:Uncharacterized protein n=1 Tax=Mucilaginibacter gracilis TaxID=423350 RepID=A0A495J4C9_9SPHI|nr:hypothetical protein [Mucilaginibacter gracilis]RKR83194.1 hypothetical protein BDD43_3396 [Mucilaginibacter gracilis]
MGAKKVVTPQPGQGIPAVVDPNKSLTASNKAEAAADALTLKAAIAAKAANEQEHKDQVQTDAEAAIIADQEKEAEANERFAAIDSDMALIYQLMDDHGVDTLFENSNQEYFTALDRAVLSEGGDVSRVKTHTL